MVFQMPQAQQAQMNQQSRRPQKAKPIKKVIAVNLPEDLQTIEAVTSTFYPYGEILLARVLRHRTLFYTFVTFINTSDRVWYKSEKKILHSENVKTYKVFWLHVMFWEAPFKKYKIKTK